MVSFKSGIMPIEDMPRSGRNSTGRNDENSADIKCAMNKDRWKTIVQMFDETNTSWSMFTTMVHTTQLSWCGSFRQNNIVFVHPHSYSPDLAP
ncbi:hypothetical protein TNCV_3055331 [Trichonephila clavipes]|nr:hypothetical protein TNCV_3055331 [Trichonephila clavipes]